MSSFQRIIVFLSFAASYQLAVAADYRVEITNLTYKIAFTPRIVIAHVPVSLFAPGDNLNDTSTGLLNGQMNHALSEIAEAGSLGPIMAILDQESVRNFVSYVVGSGLLVGGKKQSVELLDVDDAQSHLSLFAMLLPTNDGFIALNNMALPQNGSVQYYLNAYDAGTETNTESCEDIPGPLCGGTGQSPNDAGEGFVHIHTGIRGLNPDEIDPAEYDWKNPVAVVTITRMQ
ncbi:spondin domain-containing protein [Nitrosomonas marina]|uniref:spondin domain-containing protein n=1 Tax=Nitrosomonas marina TaxID=917 RepID=UPI001C4335EC|nr:spondin domain-containing protein [Nitrosomonas marina]